MQTAVRLLAAVVDSTVPRYYSVTMLCTLYICRAYDNLGSAEYSLHIRFHSEYYTTTQPFNGLFSRTTWVSRYQKGKTNLDFTGARDSEWQWHQLGHMQVCTSLQTDNHASTPPLCFLQAGCPSCRQTNSVKAQKALTVHLQ